MQNKTPKVFENLCNSERKLENVGTCTYTYREGGCFRGNLLSLRKLTKFSPSEKIPFAVRYVPSVSYNDAHDAVLQIGGGPIAADVKCIPPPPPPHHFRRFIRTSF